MAKFYITIRLEGEEVSAINQLIKGEVFKSRSAFIRSATKMLLSQYTGEVDVNGMEKRLRALESDFNELKAKLGVNHP